uniref:Glycerol-3-phosphate acyltransferase 1, mitochondrial n=1 Tax=Astatotilapia calliptera TaxID=8154 RepID=A0AAX7VWG7_ASTCA
RKETAESMELSDGLLLQVSNGEQWCNRWKHPNEDSDRSTSPSVLRNVASTWKEGLLNRKRPFVGRCCHSCTPQSWERLFNPSIPSLGLRNVIYINETHTRQRGWLARRLSYVLFVVERDVHKDMFTRNVVDNVLNNIATDLDAAASQPGQEHKAVSKVKQKARAFLQEMVANISPAFIRLTGWVLLRLFNGFFWSIQIHKGQLEMVKKAATEQNVPMVFLPVHKSHIDYLLITLILFCHNIKAPHIAAGNNLSIPILSTLIRKLGGFFIRRRMEESADGKKDILYRSLLHAYTEELLRQQQFLEVFLEGTRSRSGKPSPARAGMLSIVVDTMCTGAIGDVLVVPVGISYDRIIEGNYNSEQLGKPKKNESWWGIACGVFRMLRKNYGCVRVDFNQPFSLKEYLDTQRSRHSPPPVSLEHALMPTIISADTSATSAFFVLFLLCVAYYTLLYLLLIAANKSSAIMSTHIVACLLLYRHRQGVVLSKLVEDFFNMKEEILSRDFDLGFSGNSEDVVMRALHLLGNCLNVTSSSNRNGEFTIAPSQTVPALFELNFYSNGLFHVFISDAIIGKLCQQYYVLFWFIIVEDQEELSPSPTDEPWPKKFAEPLSWRSDEEDEDSDFGEEQRDRYLKVSVSAEHQEFFVFLQRLLSPVLEAYSGAAIFVHSLSQPMVESDYTQRLFRYLLTRTERGVCYIALGIEKIVLKERRENKVTTLELSSTFLPQENRNKLLQYILGFTLL